MIRTIVSLLLSAVVTFGLLAFMAYLVRLGEPRVSEAAKAVQLVINPPIQESETRRKVRFKPIQPPPDTPPRPAAIQPEVLDQTDHIAFDMPNVELESSDALVTRPSALLTKEGDATPIVRIEPRYPMSAARNGTEGYVLLSFSINKVGGVEDVVVIESEPGRVFDKEARRALRRWKYKPKIVNGIAQKQINQIVQIDFSLEVNSRN